MLITVFTPTYNRGYIIHKLYDSLCRQTYENFEWLVVDDGSTDDTGTLIEKFIADKKIQICYIRQENGGKHRAINRGVREAAGTLFFIVDSDDYLTDNALERIAFHFGHVRDDNSFCGVCGLKCFPNQRRVGGECSWKVLDCSCLDFRYKHNVKGDMAEVFKTSVMREFPFPEIPGERFCTESLVWNRMATRYKIRYFYEKIYICDYLSDGLTAASVRLRRSSPEAAMIAYAEFSRYDNLPISQKIKGMINFWRFAFCSERRFFNKLKQGGVLSVMGIIPGFLMFLKDRKSEQNENSTRH